MAAAATATATTPAAGPRYAPEDPTLPKPWKGLVDGKTGYLYFWNPETNVTQYEKPTVSVQYPKPASLPISSSVQVQQSSHGQHEDERYDRGSNGESKLSVVSRSYQGTSVGIVHSHNAPNVTASDGFGGSPTSGLIPSGAGSNLSAESYRRQHEISVTGDNVPVPFTSFESAGFSSEILREVRYLLLEELMSYAVLSSLLGGLHIIGATSYNEPFLWEVLLNCSWPGLPLVLSAGFAAPTPIQAQSWPIALQNRDIVAVAKTGSGKTLGYLIPGFIHLKRNQKNPQLGPTVLVLSPTRELATQIQDEAVKFSKSSRISCTCLYGGAPKGPQLRDIDRGADIVVATPGRLNDILEMKRISLQQVSYLVLDEADRMLDMGFEPQIRKIVKEVSTRRQTLMYTATWPKEVRRIAADLLVNPVQVNIGNVDELVANKSITQHIEVLAPMEKYRRLEQILRSQEPGSKIIIFCSTKKMCDQLSRNLNRYGAAAIHGDKSQGERDHVLSQFKSGRSPVLVATDVAARGLDIKDIRVVINYDFPTGIEDYVHRIGRTGRAGASGLAYTFFGEQDAKHASDLVKVLEGAIQKVPPEVREMSSRGGGMGRNRRWGSSSSGGDFGYGGRGGRGDSGYGGRGGHGDSGYGGRNGGRGGWGMSSSTSSIPEKGGGRPFDYDSRDRDRGRSRSPVRSFHQAMMERGQTNPPSKPHNTAPYNANSAGMIPANDEGMISQNENSRY